MILAPEMSSDLLSLLSSNSLVQGLTRDQVARLAGMVRLETHPAGTMLMRQSERPDRVFLLAIGKVQVRRHLHNTEENAIADLDAGSFFGEMAVITGAARHSSSVVAMTDVTVLTLAAADFDKLIAEYPETTRNVLAKLIEQLQGLNDRWLDTLRVEKQVLEWKVRERTQELENMHQRVRRELALAQNIQRNLLPEKRKSFPGISVATDYIPCDELGGDITGVFQIDETRLAVYGGDVCGHGIYAAMVMSYVKKLIETSVKRILLKGQYAVKPPGAVLTSINQSFITEISQGDPEIYLTLFLGILDMRKLGFEYASAGIHVPPLVLAHGKAEELFGQSEYPIGHVQGHEFATARRSFSPGEVFLFVSDGVIEARRGDEVFGMERLKTVVEEAAVDGQCFDVEKVVDSVRSFLAGEPPQDDMCILGITISESDDPAK